MRSATVIRIEFFEKIGESAQCALCGSTHPRTGPNNSLYVMHGSTRHFWPQSSLHEDFLSTNAPKEERPCTRVHATAARAAHSASAREQAAAGAGR